MKWHKYFFITCWRLSLNGDIHLYQEILKILYREPTKFITKDIENTFIEFNVKFNCFLPSELFLSNTFTSESYHDSCLLSPENAQVFWYLLHDTRLTLCFRLWFGKYSFKLLEIFLEIIKLLSLSLSKLFLYLSRFLSPKSAQALWYLLHDTRLTLCSVCGLESILSNS